MLYCTKFSVLLCIKNKSINKYVINNYSNLTFNNICGTVSYF